MPRASIYVPLIAYLAAQDGDTVTLTFAEIEALIGAPLARTAKTAYSHWNAPYNRHVTDLERAGWEARLHPEARRVEFRRITYEK